MKISKDPREMMDEALNNDLLNVSYDRQEYRAVLSDQEFFQSYVNAAKTKGRQIKPIFSKSGGCFKRIKLDLKK
jgi:hypothetical protein